MIMETGKGTYVPLGETVTVDGKEYVCVASNPHRCCKGCGMFKYEGGLPVCGVLGGLACTVYGRLDRIDVIFKEIDSDDVTEK